MKTSKHYLRFNLVGLMGFALQTAVLFFLTHSPQKVNYLVATVLAVEIAILNNFYWHQRWTWVDRPAGSISNCFIRLGKFHFTNGAVSIAGNLMLMAVLVGTLRFPVTGANVISVLACGIFNFLLAQYFVFRGESPT